MWNTLFFFLSTFFFVGKTQSYTTVMDGNMSNEMDLRHFPWDFDDVNLLMAIEMCVYSYILLK